MRHPSSPDALLGFRDCNDGRTRPVFLDSNGDQYLLHEDRGRVYGMWLRRDFEPAAPATVAAEK
jgi:hypothetical protein